MAQWARSRMSHSIQPSLADSSEVPYELSTACGHTKAKMRANTGLGKRLVQSRPGTLTRGDGGSVATPALRLELRRNLSKRPILREWERGKREKKKRTKRGLMQGPPRTLVTGMKHPITTSSSCKRCFRPHHCLVRVAFCFCLYSLGEMQGRYVYE